MRWQYVTCHLADTHIKPRQFESIDGQIDRSIFYVAKAPARSEPELEKKPANWTIAQMNNWTTEPRNTGANVKIAKAKIHGKHLTSKTTTLDRMVTLLGSGVVKIIQRTLECLTKDNP